MERILSSTPVRVLLGFLLVALFSGIGSAQTGGELSGGDPWILLPDPQPGIVIDNPLGFKMKLYAISFPDSRSEIASSGTPIGFFAYDRFPNSRYPVPWITGIAPPYFPYSVELSSEGVTNSLRKTSSFERLHGKMCLTRTFLRSYSMKVEMTAWNYEMEGDTWVYKRRGSETKTIAEPEYIVAKYWYEILP
jgi:hypothetical protein